MSNISMLAAIDAIIFAYPEERRHACFVEVVTHSTALKYPWDRVKVTADEGALVCRSDCRRIVTVYPLGEIIAMSVVLLHGEVFA
jgi:hypothetical protein